MASVYGAAATFQGVSIERNAGRYGGGLALSNAAVRLRDSRIADNVASLGGGAVSAYAHGRVYLHDCVVEGNVALDGGFAWVYEGALVAVRGEFSGNTATEEGGLLYLDRSTASFTGAVVVDNVAGVGGGAAWLATGGEATGLTSTESTWGDNLAAGVDADVDGHIFDVPYDDDGEASFFCARRGCD